MHHQKKRLFALFLTLSMLLSVVQPVFAAGAPAPAAETYAYEQLDRTKMSGFTATTQKDPPQWNDGPAAYAFDGRLDTAWHSDYNDKTLPQSIEWELGGSYAVGQIVAQKKAGGNNGIWKNIKVEGKQGDQWVLLGTAENLPNADATVTFQPQTVSALRITVLDSHNTQSGVKYASVGEISVYEAVPAGSEAKQALRAAVKEAERYSAAGYTADSFAALTAALDQGRQVLSNPDAGDAAYTAAAEQLTQAIRGLAMDPEFIAPGAPANGQTQKSPFISGTAGSTNFRIPSIITLKHQKDSKLNGRLVAAIDARWNHTGDACALDTILSVSDDQGETWNYSFPNFFNDSTNAKANNATAFIDPVMVEGEDGTIYLMVDLFPGGVAINTAPRRPARESGYHNIDGKDRLVLHTMTGETQTADNYSFYVGDFADVGGKTLAPVLARDGDKQTAAYYVDQHYYLYDADKQPMYCRQLEGNANGANFVQQNVFFYNADLHVRDASYLWLVSSQDGGKTWSVPSILNPMIRKTEGTDMFYGVGPGAGLSFVDQKKTNVILLQGYTFTLGMSNYNQITSFVYTADNGRTWHRGPDATNGGHWSSESALVQIDETTVRQFYRDGSNALNYTDFIWNPETQEFTTDAASVAVPGASKTSNNQLSAIRWSKTEDGKPVYLVSTANGGGGNRSNGRIFVLTLEEDKTMQVLNTFEVNHSKYGYSSLTETADGSVALLYEGQTKDNRYGEDIYFQLITEDQLIPVMPEKKVDLKVGQTVTFPLEGQLESVTPDGIVEANVITNTESKPQGLIGVDTTFSAGVQDLDTALFTFHKQGEGNAFQITADYKGQTIYMQLNTAGGTGGYPMAGTAEGAMALEEVPGVAYRFFIKNATGGSRYLYFWKDGKCLFDAIGSMSDQYKEGSSFLLYRPAEEGEEASRELPGYVKVAAVSDVKDGGQYLIANDYNGELYVMRPSTATKSDKFSYILKVAPETTTQTLTLKGLTPGNAQVVAGGTLYNVTVAEAGPQKLTGRNVNFYAYVDGEMVLIKNLPNVTTFWIDGRQCLDAATLVSAYGELGFKAEMLTAGSSLFLHTDRGMKNIWNAGTKEYEGVVYAASTNHKVDNQGYKGNEIDMFYLPNGSVSSSVNGSDPTMIARETFYSVKGTDYEQLFFNHTEAVIALDNQSGKHWVLTGEDGANLDGQVGDTQTVFTIDSIDQPYVLTLVDDAPEVVTHTVTFKADGMEDVVLEVVDGQTIGDKLPKAPAKTGYTFNGWFDGETEITADTVVEGNITAAAKYTLNTHTVTVDGVEHQNVPYGTALGQYLTQPGKKPGHTFAGWTCEGKPVTADTLVEQDMVVLSNWNFDVFTDVAKSDWFYEQVRYATFNGLFSGVSGTEFGPAVGMDRAMVVQVLYNLAGKPDVALSHDFDDVDNTQWYAEAVAWSVKEGIASGYGNGQFGPTDRIDRQQMAVMLYAFSGKHPAQAEMNFADVDEIDAWAREGMEWAVAQGIMGGVGGNLISPHTTTTRAEAAVMIGNFYQMDK